MADALILVDFQNEWITEGSDYFVGDLTAVLENASKLIEHAKAHGMKIIFTRHVEEESEEEFAPNSPRSDIIASINTTGGMVITKHRISPFYKTDLEQELQGVDRVIVCGILTNLCVRSVVQDAYDRDFDIVLISDACKAFDQKTHDFTLEDLKATREEIEIATTEEFLKQ